MAFPFISSPIRLCDRPAIWHGSTSWSWTSVIPATYFNFWVLLEGSVRIQLRGQSFTCHQPSYFLLPSGESIKAENLGPGPMSNFTLHVSHPALPAAWRKGTALTATWGQPVRQFQSFVEMARACVDAGLRVGRAHQAYAAAMAHVLLLRFVRDVTTLPESVGRERMFALAGRMRQQPGEPWRVATLAAQTGFSRGRFTRLFTEAIGLSPRDYLTRCRMERARALLKESDMTVSEIAYSLGYGDLFFFSRHFKQVTGQSPRHYRQAS